MCVYVLTTSFYFLMRVGVLPACLCAHGTQGDPKRAMGPLGTGVTMVVTGRMGAGNQIQTPWKNIQYSETVSSPLVPPIMLT